MRPAQSRSSHLQLCDYSTVGGGLFWERITVAISLVQSVGVKRSAACFVFMVPLTRDWHIFAIIFFQ